MAPLTQAKLLRVLQEQRFERVGGGETIRTDARILAATNHDLDRLAAEGRFRNDLYFRLNVFTIRLPPLRERGDDLGLLLDFYLKRFGRELGKPAPALAPEALAALRRYHWPGNVRELQSVLKQAILLARGTVILPEELPPAVHAPAAPTEPAPGGTFDWDRFVTERIAAGSEDLYAEGLALMEREVLTRALRHTGGNQLQAARILGITRGSLRTKIRA